MSLICRSTFLNMTVYYFTFNKFEPALLHYKAVCTLSVTGAFILNPGEDTLLERLMGEWPQALCRISITEGSSDVCLISAV